MNRLFLLPVLSASVLGLAACGSPEPDAVEATPGGEPVAVSDTRADSSREVVVTVRDAQGNLLVAPRMLEQRPASAAAAPGACTPEAR